MKPKHTYLIDSLDLLVVPVESLYFQLLVNLPQPLLIKQTTPSNLN
jgi:hypothetical protein